ENMSLTRSFEDSPKPAGLFSAGEIGQGAPIPAFHRANRVLNPYINISICWIARLDARSASRYTSRKLRFPQTGLADAPGRALPARIPCTEGREGRFSRTRVRQRGRGRDHAPARPPLRPRWRDPVLRRSEER